MLSTQKHLKLIPAFIFCLLVLFFPGRSPQALAQQTDNAAAKFGVQIHVTATIRPLHSIVATMMAGVGTPSLLLNGSQSSHHASLRPSQAKILGASDIIFWIGSGLETFLTKPIDALGGDATSVALSDVSSLELLNMPGGSVDPHFWLSTQNAIVIARKINTVLVSSDPVNASLYDKNLLGFEQATKALETQMESRLESVKNKKFLIYHDALKYMEKQFEFETRSVALGNEELTPSAKQIVAIGRLARSGEYHCMLIEPNINAAAVTSRVMEAKLPIAVLDPIGSDIKAGPDHYSTLMLGLARTISDCIN